MDSDDDGDDDDDWAGDDVALPLPWRPPAAVTTSGSKWCAALLDSFRERDNRTGADAGDEDARLAAGDSAIDTDAGAASTPAEDSAIAAGADTLADSAAGDGGGGRNSADRESFLNLAIEAKPPLPPFLLPLPPLLLSPAAAWIVANVTSCFDGSISTPGGAAQCPSTVLARDRTSEAVAMIWARTREST
jgi:hypothetical protein